MALLDFIRNREGQRPAGEQQSQQQQPETPSQQPGRQAADPDAPLKAVANLPDAEKTKAREIGSRVDQVAENISQNAPVQASAPADSASSPQAVRQNMTGQDKPAPDLSPTSANKGIPMKDVEGPEAPAATPAKTQERERQTIARPTPSWER